MVEYCKYCYEEHDNWESAEYSHGDPDFYTCGNCDHTSWFGEYDEAVIQRCKEKGWV